MDRCRGTWSDACEPVSEEQTAQENRCQCHTERDTTAHGSGLTAGWGGEGRLPDPGFRGDEQQGGMVDFAVFDLAIELV